MDIDDDVVGLHDLLHGLFIERHGQSLFVDRDAAESDARLFRHHGRFRIAHCRHDAAPVRVLAEEGRLGQRGTGDAHAHLLRVRKGLRAGHVDGEELRSPFAVCGDLLAISWQRWRSTS